MRFSEVLRLGESYLFLGVLIAAVVLLLVFGGYFILYKKIFKGEKTIHFWNFFWGAVLICYVVIVLGATMFSRSEMARGSIRLQPFYSYRMAWNSFSPREWRNLILNILMFIPFGFMLPLVFVRFRTFWKTYLAGLVFTLFIEISQIVFQRGVFETDDVLNNLLGAMIGYGCCRLFAWLAKSGKKDGKREPFHPVLLLQLPLLLTVGMFCGIFLIYHYQELGNLSNTYITRFPSERLEIVKTAEFSKETKKCPVYRLHVADQEETKKQAEEFFGRLQDRVDDSQTSYLDDTVIYYSDSGTLSLWIDYAGGKLEFTDFDAVSEERKTDASQNEVLHALKALGVTVPEGAEFENGEDGSYGFRALRLIEGERMYHGSLFCTLAQDGRIANLTQGILPYEKYKDFDVISEQEAYEQLCSGKFRFPSEEFSKNKLSIKVSGVTLTYENDTKGFCQPVYAFQTEINKKAVSLRIPAISR